MALTPDSFRKSPHLQATLMICSALLAILLLAAWAHWGGWGNCC
ncbi:hypothetical protein [Lujinxingia litoralis]|nr:hypothetical protein [Lujinxingia litoralis]